MPLEREKENLQKLLDEAVKAQGEPKAPKRSRADADDPGAGDGRKVAEQEKQAKAEADKLVNKANNYKQLIYERIDTCLSEYDSPVRSFEPTMAWLKSGRKAVREMLQAQAAEAEQEKAAKADKKKQINWWCLRPVRMRMSVSTFITQCAAARPPAPALKQICFVPMRCASRIAPPVKLHTTGSTMWNEVRAAPGQGE